MGRVQEPLRTRQTRGGSQTDGERKTGWKDEKTRGKRRGKRLRRGITEGRAIP